MHAYTTIHSHFYTTHTHTITLHYTTMVQNRKLLKRLLERKLPGAKVNVASSAEKALRMCGVSVKGEKLPHKDVTAYTVVFLDQHMQGMTGGECARLLKKVQCVYVCVCVCVCVC
jgi:CheY-like chemotaxis protein